MNTVLVTGGAGYIGSHVTWALHDAGFRVIVLDDLSTGVRRNVPGDADFVEGDVADGERVKSVLRQHAVSAVLHFAGSIVVPESVTAPLAYYRNNSAASRTLIEACVRHGIEAFVFSSTAAVYGEPDAVPIAESAPLRPASPYGRSKLITEWMLEDAAHAHGLQYLALRYFNVAGADPDGRTGQSTPNATHLIKVACEVAAGLRPFIQVYGDDYETPDGTCVRDYIHVSDLADAHVAALRHLQSRGGAGVLNCGYGRGFSVHEVLRSVERVVGTPLDIRRAPRRAGDPSILVADSRQLRETLGWRPRLDDLDTIVGSALAWERFLASVSSGVRSGQQVL